MFFPLCNLCQCSVTCPLNKCFWMLRLVLLCSVYVRYILSCQWAPLEAVQPHCSFKYLWTFGEILSETSLFQAKESQTFSLFPCRNVLVFHHLSGPVSDSLWYCNICLLLETSELNTELQVWPD